MSARTNPDHSLQQSVIKQQCLALRLPTVAGQCGPLADQAERERQPYLGYLVSLAMAKSPVVAEVVPDFGHACPHWWPGKSPTRV
jgi:hypothetical protein